MAGFVFKLDPLLRQRQREEDERKREVASLDRQRIEIEQRIRQIQERITENKSELTGRLIERVDANAIRSQAAMTFKLDAEARTLVIQLARLHKELKQARTVLVEASAKRKAIERLRERRYSAWLYEQERRETAEMDDLVTMRFGRGHGVDVA